MVSCTPHKALQCGHSKCSPATCSRRSSSRFGSPSKRHWLTRHCGESPSAALKSSFGVILLMSPPSLQKQIPARSSSAKFLLRLTASGEERAKRLSNAKASYLPERGAKPAQERNEINGRGPLAGRMPFMSASTLNRRSAALYGAEPDQLSTLPTENSEEPKRSYGRCEKNQTGNDQMNNQVQDHPTARRRLVLAVGRQLGWTMDAGMNEPACCITVQKPQAEKRQRKNQ